ncbi:hypothetical protein [uncultured Roseibium sp.]|uniref:hypothetical protein n=1 Tax=uncultured Roseibium sp. TaxID=1936171 RepID=UPI00260E8DE0|nr:hypothetical protein [uncultured Roseibium sp.]
MAMVQTNTRTHVVNMTRVQMREATVKAWLQIAADQGYDTSFFDERLSLFVRMELVSHLKMFICKDKKAVTGIALRMDHDKGRSEMERHGEDFASELIDEYGLSGSITEMLSALRTYVTAMFAQGGATHIEIWYTFAPEKIAEYGKDRLYQMIDVESTPETQEASRKRYAELTASIPEQSRTATPPALSEYSFLITTYKVTYD